MRSKRYCLAVVAAVAGWLAACAIGCAKPETDRSGTPADSVSNRDGGEIASAEPRPRPPAASTANAPSPGGAAWHWRRLDVPADRPGISHETAATYDLAADRIVLFGGHGVGGGSERADTWLFDPKTGAWTNPEPINRPVGACCVRENVYDESAGVTYYFGGHSHEHGWQWYGPRIRGCRLDQWGKYRMVDIPWIYDAAANTWRCAKPLISRPKKAYTGAAWHAAHQVAVTFASEKFDDDAVWVYDGYTNTWTRLEREGDGPPVGRIPAMAYDATNNRVLAYATDLGSKQSDQFWAYQLETNRWTRLPSEGGPPRILAQLLVWDPVNDWPILYATGPDRDGPLKVFVYQASSGRWVDQPTEPVVTNMGKWHVNGVYDPVGHRTFILNGTNKSLRSGPGGGTLALPHPRRDADRGPDRPGGVRVVTSTDQAELTWQPVAGATAYRVWRGTAPLPWQATCEVIAQTAGTSYTDPAAPRGRVSFYYVTPVDAAGRTGPASLKVRTQPRVPAEPVVSALARDRVQIAWAASGEPDVVGYNVYRYAGPGRDRTAPRFENADTGVKLNAAPLAQRTLTDRFELPDPTKVFVRYVVTAVNRLGVESGPSAWATIIPTEPTGVRVEPTPGGAAVTWRANPQQGIAGYNVYRADDRNAEIRELARKIAGPIAATRYLDAAKTDARPAKYYITAIDALGQEGYASYGAWVNDAETR